MMAIERQTTHIGELRLRRFRAGELDAAGADEINAHTAGCGHCRAKLRSLEDEQRQFEREISFERFAGGVERAQRVPRRAPRRAWVAGVAAFAAAAAALLVLRPEGARENRLKGGGATATVRVAAADGSGQRAVAPGGVEVLRAGDRVRIGYRADAPGTLIGVSVDDAGEVTVVYPGTPVAAATEVQYLPDSLEFTGAGRERLFIVLSAQAVAADAVAQAARAAHAVAGGDLGRMPPLALESQEVSQFTWLFQKP